MVWTADRWLQVLVIGLLGACDKNQVSTAQDADVSSQPVVSASVATTTVPERSVPARKFNVVIDAQMVIGGTSTAITLRGGLVQAQPIPRLAGAWEIWNFKDVAASVVEGTNPPKPLVAPSENVYLLRDRDGEPLSVAFAANTPAMLRQVVEYTIGALKSQRPSAASLVEGRRERDASGWFTTKYAKLPDGRLARSKLAYERESRKMAWTVDSSEWSALFDSNGRLETLSSSDNLTGNAEPLQVKLKTFVTVKSASDDSLATSLDGAPPKTYSVYNFGESGRGSQQDTDRAVAGKMLLQDVFRSLEAEKVGWSNKYQGAAFLRLHDDAIDAVQALVAKTPSVFDNALALLTETGTLKAQSVIAEWLTTSETPRRKKIWTYIGRNLRHPRQPLLDQILTELKLPGGEREALWQVTGSLVSQATAENAEHAADWTKQVSDLWRAVSEPTERVLALEKIGSIRDTTIEQLAIDALSNENEEVVLRAISALGNQRTDTANAELLKIALSSPSPRRRFRAYEAMAIPAIAGNLEQLLKASTAERDDTVLAALVRALARVAGTEKAALARLKQLAELKPSSGVAREAKRALERLNRATQQKEKDET